MSLFPQATPAELSGTLDGRLLGGRGTITLGEDAIDLRLTHASPAEREGTRIPYGAISGIVAHARRITVAAPARGTLVVEGDDRIGVIGAELEARLFRLPEMTRALRELGSHRASHPEGAAHATYFAPLLEARRVATALEQKGAPHAQVAGALRSASLRGALASARGALAQGHAEGAARRAVEARLEDACEPLEAALETLRIAEEGLASAEPLAQADAWRRWSGALAHVFEMADRCWPAVDATLAQRIESPAPARSRWWRRSRGGSA